MMTQLPILILPGTLCTGKMFREQINHLQQYCQDITVVQFSTEKSLTEMANKVIKASKNQPCAIVGFSMGGIVALEIAKTHPQLIAKLALVNSNCQIIQVKSGKLIELVTEIFLPNYLFKTDNAHEELIIEMARALGADCFVAQVMAIEDRPDFLPVLQQLKSDILIIGGKQDKICSVEHQQLMHKNSPGSHLQLLDQCGHFAPLEQAENVSNLLTHWYLSMTI
jgi:pimeloyl-ACP methyl ester carboxylesterase